MTAKVAAETVVTIATVVEDHPLQLLTTHGESVSSLTRVTSLRLFATTVIAMVTPRSSALQRSVSNSTRFLHLPTRNTSLSLVMLLILGHTQPQNIHVLLWHWFW